MEGMQPDWDPTAELNCQPGHFYKMGRICKGVQAMAQCSQKLRPTVKRSWCSELLRSGAFPGKWLKPGDKTSVLSCNAGRTWKSLSPYNSKNKKNKWENLDFSQTFLGLRLQAQLPPKIRGVTARTIMSSREFWSHIPVRWLWMTDLWWGNPMKPCRQEGRENPSLPSGMIGRPIGNKPTCSLW